jgi:hypothetical protein
MQDLEMATLGWVDLDLLRFDAAPLIAITATKRPTYWWTFVLSAIETP